MWTSECAQKWQKLNWIADSVCSWRVAFIVRHRPPSCWIRQVFRVYSSVRVWSTINCVGKWKIEALIYSVRGNELSFAFFSPFSSWYSHSGRLGRFDWMAKTIYVGTAQASQFCSFPNIQTWKRCGFIGWAIIISTHCNGRTDGRVNGRHRTHEHQTDKLFDRNERVIDPRHRQQYLCVCNYCVGISFFIFKSTVFFFLLSSGFSSFRRVHITMKTYFKDTFSYTLFIRSFGVCALAHLCLHTS